MCDPHHSLSREIVTFCVVMMVFKLVDFGCPCWWGFHQEATFSMLSSTVFYRLFLSGLASTLFNCAHTYGTIEAEISAEIIKIGLQTDI